MEIDTPQGPARADVRVPVGASAAIVLGHGAGRGIGAPDLTAAASVAEEKKLAVALGEQPYRVAGRRSPPPAPQLDAAWLAVVAALREGPLTGRRFRQASKFLALQRVGRLLWLIDVTFAVSWRAIALSYVGIFWFIVVPILMTIGSIALAASIISF